MSANLSSVGSNDQRGEFEVWVESFRAHAFVRVGPTRNFVTVNDPKYAECIRKALQEEIDKECAPRANGNASKKEIGNG